MFVSDLKREFLAPLAGKRVIIIANIDIDSIVASKILQNLFRNENIMFSVAPVMGVKGMKKVFDDNKEDCNIFLFINCGGCLDLVELLEPVENIVFFICDSHRPLDLCNIYSDSQVRILGDPRNEEEIPPFDQVFREDESDGDESFSDDDGIANGDENMEDNDHNDENVDENGRSRQQQQITHIERFERRLRKNRERREWEKIRDRVLFNYSQYSYYTRSTALTFFELAWQTSKDTLDLLWWGLVGITEQLIMAKIESSTYTLEAQKIQSHVSRLTNKLNENSKTSCKITYENDLYLALYRHWSIKESLKNSIYPACKMKLWTLNGIFIIDEKFTGIIKFFLFIFFLGKKKLKELLVEMGLPLVQARQQFNSMDLLMKQDFYKMIERTAEKYNMPDIIYGSFTLSYGYKNRYSAADYVYAMMALTEQIEHERTAEVCFLDALECLSRNKNNILESGIDKAKVLLDAIFKQVKTSLETQQIFSAGPFLYLILQEENILFSSPYGLTMLSKFMLNGYIAVSRSRRAKDLPLITCIPIDTSRDICLMIGIPPVGDDTKNLFGKAFEQAAIKSNAAISQDFFDTNIIQIKQSDCPKFIDALTVLLAS